MKKLSAMLVMALVAMLSLGAVACDEKKPDAEATPATTTEGDAPAAAAEGDKPAETQPAAEGDKPAAGGDMAAPAGDMAAPTGDKPAEGDAPADDTAPPGN